MGVWGRCGGYGGVAIIGDLEWLRWLWGGSETVLGQYSSYYGLFSSQLVQWIDSMLHQDSSSATGFYSGLTTIVDRWGNDNCGSLG
jgi:hypothetical protein